MIEHTIEKSHLNDLIDIGFKRLAPSASKIKHIRSATFSSKSVASAKKTSAHKHKSASDECVNEVVIVNEQAAPQQATQDVSPSIELFVQESLPEFSNQM